MKSNKMKCGVYQILNVLNGKVYVGSSVHMGNRRYNHFWSLRANKHYNAHLQRAYNLYGEDNFIFEVLEYCSPDSVLEREQYYIDVFNSCDPSKGYNVAKYAQCSFRGLHRTNLEKLNLRMVHAERFKHKKVIKSSLRLYLPDGKFIVLSYNAKQEQRKIIVSEILDMYRDMIEETWESECTKDCLDKLAYYLCMQKSDAMKKDTGHILSLTNMERIAKGSRHETTFSNMPDKYKESLGLLDVDDEY